MKHFKSCILLCIVILQCIMASAQTLNYSGQGWSTSSCNVFNVSPPKAVAGLNHFPLSGGASYNGSALVLNTQGGTSYSSTYGTAYAIEYQIKQNYRYTITVSASKQSNDQYSYPTIEVGLLGSLSNLNPNVTQPAACGSVNQNSWIGFQAN